MHPDPLPRLVLASTSPYRRDLLTRLGLPFTARAPGCDEESLKARLGRGTPPDRLAAALARAKAESLAEAEPGALVIGADQVAALDGEILGKPGTAEQAAAQLARLAGRAHVLFTAVALCAAGEVREHLDATRLFMRPLGRSQIERYVAADAPLDCAGSYRIEARGIALFERIESADHTAIIGFPLMALTSMLCAMGYPVP